MDHLLSIASILATATSLLAGQAGSAGYTPGSTGYDISFPQCGAAYPGGAFGVVGVNGGYPFVPYHPCLAGGYRHSPHRGRVPHTRPTANRRQRSASTRPATSGTRSLGAWR